MRTDFTQANLKNSMWGDVDTDEVYFEVAKYLPRELIGGMANKRRD